LSGRVFLFNKVELENHVKNKSKLRIFDTLKPKEKEEVKQIVLRTTSKLFKRLYTLEEKSDLFSKTPIIYIKEKHDYDLLLHKALKYTR